MLRSFSMTSKVLFQVLGKSLLGPWTLKTLEFFSFTVATNPVSSIALLALKTQMEKNAQNLKFAGISLYCGKLSKKFKMLNFAFFSFSPLFNTTTTTTNIALGGQPEGLLNVNNTPMPYTFQSTCPSSPSKLLCEASNTYSVNTQTWTWLPKEKERPRPEA